jgi:DNA integrity scanning protein DisA with diadenylate cyclase activity
MGGAYGIRAIPFVVARSMTRDERRALLDATFGVVCESARCSDERRETLEEVIQLAVELAREGREGRKIGTLFVVGDVDSVLEQSRSLLLDPLYGHPSDILHVGRPELRETIKELAQLDGAFVLDDSGTFVSAGRFVDVDVNAPENFFPGLGTRHAAAASISRTTGAISIAVSQSSVVRVFAGGKLRAEIIPELFLLSKERLFTPTPEIRELPEAGVTLAVAGDEAA